MNIKISIITVCLNNEETILRTLNSIINQSYKNIEHIIIDGGSIDKTKYYLKNYSFKNKKIYFKKNLGLYDSINFAIKESKGEIITFLHADDIFNSNNTIEKVIKKINKSKNNIFLGDVVYFNNNYKKIYRYYSVNKFKIKTMVLGNMPPHTGSFYRKEIFKKYKLYKNFKIAADFEHLLRILYRNNEKYTTLNMITTRMKSGGLASKNLRSYLIINNELIKSLRLNNIYSNYFLIHLRIIYKITQYFFLKKKINSNFIFTKSKFLKQFEEETLKVITNIKKLNFKRNFYLSAINLAFLGSFARGEIFYDKNMINWPDGIFTKFFAKIKKFPGREIIRNLNLPPFIKKIVVIGNLSPNGYKYLKNKFNRKIINYKLPYGNINNILKKTKIKLQYNEIIFLTLPTPKQEQLAKFLSSNNKYFKIICIGGSINIISGDEKKVPDLFINFEFLWRLRYETKRRIFRLFQTFYYVFIDQIYFKKLDKLKIKLL